MKYNKIVISAAVALISITAAFAINENSTPEEYYTTGSIQSFPVNERGESYTIDENGDTIIMVAIVEADKVKQEVAEMEAARSNSHEAFIAVDVQAEFPGGIPALMQWLGQNIRYPDYAIKNDIQGRVIVRMVVDKNGYVSYFDIAKSVHPVLDEEALRVVSAMPRWKPALINGVPVNSYYNLPISFRFNPKDNFSENDIPILDSKQNEMLLSPIYQFLNSQYGEPDSEADNSYGQTGYVVIMNLHYKTIPAKAPSALFAKL